MGNIKAEQESFKDGNGNTHYWCAECEMWEIQIENQEHVGSLYNEDEE